jgi:hypothetical protein
MIILGLGKGQVMRMAGLIEYMSAFYYRDLFFSRMHTNTVLSFPHMPIGSRYIANTLLLAVRERHYGPFSAPSPFAGIGTTTIGLLTKLLVLASR